MFQGLAEQPAHDPTNPDDLAELTAIAASMHEAAGDGDDNPTVPSGYVYLGQFVDHDITFDPSSQLQRQCPGWSSADIYPAGRPSAWTRRPLRAQPLST